MKNLPTLLLLAVMSFLMTVRTLTVYGGKATQRASVVRGGPPSGDYSCMKSRLTFSSVRGPAGPLMMVQYDPSVIGTIKLDGKGGYQSFKKRGRYSFDAKRRKFSFISGPLQGWPVVYQVTRGTPMLRLAATRKGAVGASTRIGEHSCRLRTNKKFADSPPPGGGSGTTRDKSGTPGQRNAGARGTLIFRESWGSNSIMEVNLATGNVQSRFEGRDAFRSARGETAFLNRQGALVIAGAMGRAVATVAVPDKLGRPDMPVLSPDGSKIAFHVEPIYYDSRVLITTRSGKLVAEFKDATEPNWTPDGRLVVAKDVGTVESKLGIYISDKGLSKLTRIDPNLDNASWPAVSPNGQRLAFVHHGHIWLMNLNGTNLKQLTRSDNGEERPSWSPDGQWLVAAQKEYGTVLLISVKDGRILKMTNKDDRPMQSQGRLTWR